MEIGTKLKNARTKSGLTQEKVALEIGVSRQSVSNWENGRSYPDIVSVIKLSDLYSVSLDELLKEDKKMINHLDEATNTVKSRRKFTQLIFLGIYILVWAAAVICFYVLSALTEAPLAAKSMTVAYVVGVLYITLPVTSFGISTALGIDRGHWIKWAFPVVFGIMEALALNATILAETPDISLTAFGALFVGIASAAGMGIGTLIRFLKDRKKSGNTENNNTPKRAGA